MGLSHELLADVNPHFVFRQLLFLTGINSTRTSMASKLILQTRLAIGSLLVLSLVLAACTESAAVETDDIEHVRVFYEEGRFAGWPANHGIWIWGNEILVGFVEARYEDTGGFHTYDQSTSRDRYARSLDGGLTWTIEDAYEHGQTAWRYNNVLPGDMAEEPVPFSGTIDFTHPDLALTFLRATNHIGPSHFYYSYDRGRTWEGPFILPNMDTHGVATRTDYIVDGEHELLAFLTVGKSNGREGRVASVRTMDGGKTWERIAWLGPEPEGFDIMPSSVRLSPAKLLTVIRTRDASRQDLLTAYVSEDNARTWTRVSDPASDTGRGGSPPALRKLQDGRLALTYVYRSDEGSEVHLKFSSDEGQTWSDAHVLRQNDGATTDVGYPRMVQRPDGKLVIVYYWNNALLEDSAPFRYIAATIVDPTTLE